MSEARKAAWDRLVAPGETLSELFADDPGRVATLSARFELPEGGVLFDWSKTHLTEELLAGFEALAEASGFAEQRRKLFAGEVVITMFIFLTPIVATIPFYGLEIFVGVIQAFIFGMLTLVFAMMAVEHGDHEAHDETHDEHPVINPEGGLEAAAH